MLSSPLLPRRYNPLYLLVQFDVGDCPATDRADDGGHLETPCAPSDWSVWSLLDSSLIRHKKKFSLFLFFRFGVHVIISAGSISFAAHLRRGRASGDCASTAGEEQWSATRAARPLLLVGGGPSVNEKTLIHFLCGIRSGPSLALSISILVLD